MRELIASILWVIVCLNTLAAPPVLVSQPIEREVTDYADFSGTLAAVAEARIVSQVSGYVAQVNFKDGSLVKKGELLFQLDDRRQKAELQKAEAALTLAQARRQLAEADFRRGAALAKTGAIGKEELEKLDTARLVADAEVLVARAGIELARVNLDYIRITSPIDGQAGRVLISPGNFVAEGQTLMAEVITVDPLYVQFQVDEVTILRQRRRLDDGKAGAVPILLRTADEEAYSRQAQVDFVNIKFDDKTGTLLVRGKLANADRKLLPGQSVQVRLPLGGPKKALLVSDDVVILNKAFRKAVLIVNAQNVVEEREVKTGSAHEGLRSIESGLKADEWVVVGGGRDLKVGDKVEPKRVAMPNRPAQKSERPALPDFPAAGPALVLRAAYPGASARVVEETVAAPIEWQLKGLENLTQLFLACREGEMQATLVFKPGTDMAIATVLVQNRFTLALPVLPEEVQKLGVNLIRRPALLLGVALRSPDGSRDRTALAKMARDLRDDLQRVPQIAEVAVRGDGFGPETRLDIDGQKLAALGLTMSDAAQALRDQQLLEPGRGKSADELGQLIVKTDKDGRVIRLRDVARIATVQGWDLLCNLDGKPCVLLLVHQNADANPKETSKAVQARLAALAKTWPAGVEYRVVGQ